MCPTLWMIMMWCMPIIVLSPLCTPRVHRPWFPLPMTRSILATAVRLVLPLRNPWFHDNQVLIIRPMNSACGHAFAVPRASSLGMSLCLAVKRPSSRCLTRKPARRRSYRFQTTSMESSIVDAITCSTGSPRLCCPHSLRVRAINLAPSWAVTARNCAIYWCLPSRSRP